MSSAAQHAVTPAPWAPTAGAARREARSLAGLAELRGSPWMMLHLGHPLEDEFWKDPGVVRAYARWDMVAVTCSILLNMLVLRGQWRVFTNPATALSTLSTSLQNALFLPLGVAQLAWMLRRPGAYGAVRHRAIAANRLLRLGFHVLGALVTTPANMGLLMASIQANSPADAGAAVRLARALLLMPQVHWGASNYVTRWQQLLPLQLLTLGLWVFMMRCQVCWLAAAPTVSGMVVPTCQAMDGAVYAAARLILGLPGGAYPGLGAGVCSDPLSAAYALTVFTLCAYMILLPFVPFYLAELGLKTRFVRTCSSSRRGVLQPGWRWAEQRPAGFAWPAAIALASLVLLLASWWAAVGFVSLLPPLACDAGGWLVRAHGRSPIVAAAAPPMPNAGPGLGFGPDSPLLAAALVMGAPAGVLGAHMFQVLWAALAA